MYLLLSVWIASIIFLIVMLAPKVRSVRAGEYGKHNHHGLYAVIKPVLRDAYKHALVALEFTVNFSYPYISQTIIWVSMKVHALALRTSYRLARFAYMIKGRGNELASMPRESASFFLRDMAEFKKTSIPGRIDF